MYNSVKCIRAASYKEKYHAQGKRIGCGMHTQLNNKKENKDDYKRLYMLLPRCLINNMIFPSPVHSE